MPGIFISYRREDSIGHTGRLYDLLTSRFGKDRVFMDIDTIGPGEDFAEVIDRTCATCDVLLAVIGRSWLNMPDQSGNRRLDDPGDFVRLEIARALEKGIRVVPILVGGAQMPDARSLPPDLKKLALRNAWEVNDMRFHHDVGLLIEALEKRQTTLRSSPSIEPNHIPVPATNPAVLPRETPPPLRSERGRPRLSSRSLTYAGIAAVGAIAIIWSLVGHFRSLPPQPGPSASVQELSASSPSIAPLAPSAPSPTQPSQPASSAGESDQEFFNKAFDKFFSGTNTTPGASAPTKPTAPSSVQQKSPRSAPGFDEDGFDRLYGVKSASALPAPKTQEFATSYQNYHDPSGVFTLTYPPGWTVRHCERSYKGVTGGSATEFTAPGGGGAGPGCAGDITEGFAVFVYPPSETDLDQWIKTLIDGYVKEAGYRMVDPPSAVNFAGLSGRTWTSRHDVAKGGEENLHLLARTSSTTRIFIEASSPEDRFETDEKAFLASINSFKLIQDRQ